MSIACPRCGSRHLRPARNRSFAEVMGRLRFVAPLRCLDCNKRFVGPTVIWKDLLYARCPVCLRMDLATWTGKTYRRPPLWVGLRVAFGAHRWRCEYCRMNFAGFRPRKEVFTFARWAKFAPAPETQTGVVEVTKEKGTEGADNPETSS